MLINNSIIWLGLFFVFLFLEIMSVSLITIWFAISSLIVFVLSYFIISTKIQILIFSIISLALFISIKPLFNKIKYSEEKINGIGDEVKILKIEEYNYVVSYKGIEWNAKSENLNEYKVGEVVKIKRFEGNNIII